MQGLRSRLVGLIATLALGCWTQWAVAELYHWVDAQGKSHFSDKNPALDSNPQAKVLLPPGPTAPERLKSLQKELGQVVLKRVKHGQYQQYIPAAGLKNFRIVVVNHGMFGPKETALESAAATLKIWIKFAKKYQVSIVAPVFDNDNFAVTEDDSDTGGYRGLFGREVGADIFLHEIIQEYQSALVDFDGRFYLSGHSAGAQFANRYLVRHPDRVIAAAFSAPAWFAQPSADFAWPYGMGRKQMTAIWPGDIAPQKIDIKPDLDGWFVATQRPVAVVVGEQDLTKIRHVDGIGGDTHVARAQHWVNAMNHYAEQFGAKGQMEFILVPRVGHNYGKLARECQRYLGAHL